MTITLEANPTATRLAALSESQTLAMAARVRALRAEGRDIVSLTLGEPDFDTPGHIKAAAIRAIEENCTHYPPVAGIPELREAVAKHISQEHGYPCTAKQVVVSTGAKQSLLNVIMSLVNPGEEVIIPAPFWVSYIPMTQMAEGKPVILDATDASLKLNPAALEAAITPKTKLFLLNSPSNPSGVTYTNDELAEIAAVLARHPHVYILSDEIYGLIRYRKEYKSIGAFESVRARTIVVSGVSKAFAMTGWRIGFMAGPEWVAQACEKFQGQITSGANSIAQKAALAAVSSDLGTTHEMARIFQKRRDFALGLFAAELPDCPVPTPEGAFYLLPDVSLYFGLRTPDGTFINNADDMTDFLLDTAEVAVVSGVAFGAPTRLRLSYACSEADMAKAVLRMRDGLKLLH